MTRLEHKIGSTEGSDMADIVVSNDSMFFSDCPDDLVDTEKGAQRTTHELSVGRYVTHQNVPYVSFEGDLYPYGMMNSVGERNAPETCYQFTMNLSDFNAYVDALVKLRDDIKE